MLVLDMIDVDWIVKKEGKKKSIGTLRCLSYASNPLGFGVWQLKKPSKLSREDLNTYIVNKV